MLNMNQVRIEYCNFSRVKRKSHLLAQEVKQPEISEEEKKTHQVDLELAGSQEEAKHA